MRKDILSLVVGWTLILLCIPLAIVGLSTLILGDGLDFAIRAFLFPLLLSLEFWGSC